jgi:hypothetical protein
MALCTLAAGSRTDQAPHNSTVSDEINIKLNYFETRHIIRKSSDDFGVIVQPASIIMQ